VSFLDIEGGGSDLSFPPHFPSPPFPPLSSREGGGLRLRCMESPCAPKGVQISLSPLFHSSCVLLPLIWPDPLLSPCFMCAPIESQCSPVPCVGVPSTGQAPAAGARVRRLHNPRVALTHPSPPLPSPPLPSLRLRTPPRTRYPLCTVPPFHLPHVFNALPYPTPGLVLLRRVLRTLEDSAEAGLCVSLAREPSIDFVLPAVSCPTVSYLCLAALR